VGRREQRAVENPHSRGIHNLSHCLEAAFGVSSTASEVRSGAPRRRENASVPLAGLQKSGRSRYSCGAARAAVHASSTPSRKESTTCEHFGISGGDRNLDAGRSCIFPDGGYRARNPAIQTKRKSPSSHQISTAKQATVVYRKAWTGSRLKEVGESKLAIPAPHSKSSSRDAGTTRCGTLEISVITLERSLNL
jgi:hypothetical protein